MTEEDNVAAAEPTQEVAVEAQQDAPEREKAGLQDALVAERRKRQDAEAGKRYLEQQLQSVQSQYQTKQPAQADDEDEYTKEIKQFTETQIQSGIKSAIERQYIGQNPQLLEQDQLSGRTWLEEKLAPILQKKPYLAQAIQNAENRYERAMEIINDYTPKTGDQDTRKRLEENQSKPGNPAGVAKSGNLNKLEQIKNMSRKEFSEYRANVRGRSANIR